MNKYYKHWNDFVKNWLTVQDGPDYVHNSVSKDYKIDEIPPVSFPDLTRKYIPEPWWGNNGDDPLYSVCINLNPGGGDLTLQSTSNSQLGQIKDYSDVFGMLPKTNSWHSEKRAMPIGKALMAAKGFNAANAGRVENHLSIELIPWHTMHADSAHGYWKYVRNCIEEVFFHSFMFAVDEAERITGPLNKTVLLRFSGDDAQKVFKYFKKRGLINCIPEITPLKDLSDPNVHATVFKLPAEAKLSGHRFVAIWRSHGWGLNNFPNQESMTEIFRQL